MRNDQERLDCIGTPEVMNAERLVCTQVVIKRAGLRSISCGSVRELSRWFRSDPIPGKHLDRSTKINRMAEHCLCPVDLNGWAEANDYVLEYDCGDYIARKK